MITQSQGTAKNGLSVDEKTGLTGAVNTGDPWNIHGNSASGIMGTTTDYPCCGWGNGQENYGRQISINVNHAHTLSSNDNETRSINYTIKIWERIN